MRGCDVRMGVASSGLHANGFSLVRKILAATTLSLDARAPFAQEHSLGSALLTSTRLYVRSALAAMRAAKVKGMAHITGGGITENLPRVLPVNVNAQIFLGSWRLPPVFRWLSGTGGVREREMLRTFNCGIGLVAVVAAETAGACVRAFTEAGEEACEIGVLRQGSGDPRVEYTGQLFQ